MKKKDKKGGSKDEWIMKRKKWKKDIIQEQEQ